MPTYNQHPSSFRDPSGFVFESDGKIYRQINQSYADNYKLMMGSGLYDVLSKKSWLISHNEIHTNLTGQTNYHITIQPSQLINISYPYEWCFEQLKDAALLTLNIVKESISKGMILKDATPYNIQFIAGKPLLIDTLSFEKYDESKPWIAYRQFCETFLFPLLVSRYTSFSTSKLFLAYPEGISAQITAGLLPFRSKFKLGNWLHVFMPASMKGGNNKKPVHFTKTKLLQIVDHLQGMVQGLLPQTKSNSTWSNYYEETILSQQYLEEKKKLVSGFVTMTDAHSALDLGSNDGIFAEMVGEQMNVVAVDGDETCITALYRSTRKSNRNILPLCIDIMNPPSDTGWNNEERKSFGKRFSSDLVLALALIHHLCIGKNVSFERLVSFFSLTKKWLIIEFVPKHDEKVQQLLSAREDVFKEYDDSHFEAEFSRSFEIVSKKPVSGSSRTLYLMKKRNA